MAKSNIDNNSSNETKLKMIEEQQKIIDKAPFLCLKINDTSYLDTIQGRKICEKCCKSRKFFCYSCYSPVIDEKYIPQIKLPIKIDIIKHVQEINGKSTAIHAKIIAPEDVKIYTYPDFPEISETEKTVLIFPKKTAMNVEELFTKKKGDKIKTVKQELPINRAVFIDSTWQQTKLILKDERFRDLPCVMLRSRISQFWRHQKKSPRWYLATIEAIHQFLIELHINAFEKIENYTENEDSLSINLTKSIVEVSDLSKSYNGQYDNLLFFFKYMYDKIHAIYDHENLWAYKRPLV